MRMTIAMESAMTTSSSNNNNNNVKAKATPQAVPPAIAAKVPSASAVAKQNPFSKVVQSTPSKKAPVSSTPANVLTHASRPGSASVHTGKAHGHNGNSSNIVKSRTVTSFVTAAAPSSCGHNNLTSFVNNENTASQSVHNSGATSFLKNKGDSVGAGKHRTVMLSGTYCTFSLLMRLFFSMKCILTFILSILLTELQEPVTSASSTSPCCRRTMFFGFRLAEAGGQTPTRIYMYEPILVDSPHPLKI